MQGAPAFANFTMTIAGHDMTSIIRAISMLQAPTYDIPSPPSDCLYEWQLLFYRGQELLGTADLADCLVRCDGVEYQQPPVLKSLYRRIAKASREED